MPGGLINRLQDQDKQLCTIKSKRLQKPHSKDCNRRRSVKTAPVKDAEASTGRQESVTCACGRNDEENEEDGGEEEERRMVFLGQLLKTSAPLLAFK